MNNRTYAPPRALALRLSEYIEQFYRAQRCAKHEHSLRLFQTYFLYVYFIEFARNFKINFTYTNVRFLDISACFEKLNNYKNVKKIDFARANGGWGRNTLLVAATVWLVL